MVVIKGDRATIGVKGTASDPHIESFDDPDLSGLAQEVPAVVERARARWEDAPKHPAHVKPTPPAKRRNRGQQGSAAQAAADEEAEQSPARGAEAFLGAGRETEEAAAARCGGLLHRPYMRPFLRFSHLLEGGLDPRWFQSAALNGNYLKFTGQRRY